LTSFLTVASSARRMDEASSQVSGRCTVRTQIVKKHLDSIRGEELISWENYHDDIGLYTMSFPEKWDYHEDKPRSGQTIVEDRRVYIHIYFNDQRCTDERLSFSKYLTKLQRELDPASARRNTKMPTAFL
jgi:hypothetical protein